MKVTTVTPFILRTAWRELIFAKVETDAGIVGWGETRSVNKTAAIRGHLVEAADRYLIGRDPFDTERLVQEVARNDFGRPGEVVMSTLAILEVACWDIKGKVLDEPVYRLMGGAVRDRIRVYANGWYRVERTPSAFADAAARVVALGYRALKFDPFGAGWMDFTRSEKDHSLALVSAVRSAIGNEVEMMIEMHGRFAASDAIEIAYALAPFRPTWLEEPVPPENVNALRRVADAIAALGIPIAAGERAYTPADAQPLISSGVCDILQTDLTQFGGLSNARKIAAQAEFHGLRFAPHNVGGPISTAAGLHLDGCTPNAIIQENFNQFDETAFPLDTISGSPVPGGDGTVPLPPGPGLGVTIDEAIFTAADARPIHFNLFAAEWHKRGADSVRR